MKDKLIMSFSYIFTILVILLLTFAVWDAR